MGHPLLKMPLNMVLPPVGHSYLNLHFKIKEGKTLFLFRKFKTSCKAEEMIGRLLLYYITSAKVGIAVPGSHP